MFEFSTVPEIVLAVFAHHPAHIESLSVIFDTDQNTFIPNVEFDQEGTPRIPLITPAERILQQDHNGVTVQYALDLASIRSQLLFYFREKGEQPKIVSVDLTETARIYRLGNPHRPWNKHAPQRRTARGVDRPKHSFEIQRIHEKNQASCLLRCVFDADNLL